jgi:hypothetical protein
MFWFKTHRNIKRYRKVIVTLVYDRKTHKKEEEEKKKKKIMIIIIMMMMMREK